MKNKKDIFGIWAALTASLAMGVAFTVLTLDKHNIFITKNFTIDREIILVISGIFSGIIASILLKKYRKKTHRVFVLYSHLDKEKVKEMSKELDYYGIQVILDEHVINVGDDIRKILAYNIENAENLIFVISENSIKSPWIIHELELAKSLKKNIFPVNLENIVPPESIEELKYADLSEINRESIYPLYKAIVK